MESYSSFALAYPNTTLYCIQYCIVVYCTVLRCCTEGPHSTRLYSTADVLVNVTQRGYAAIDSTRHSTRPDFTQNELSALDSTRLDSNVDSTRLSVRFRSNRTLCIISNVRVLYSVQYVPSRPVQTDTRGLEVSSTVWAVRCSQRSNLHTNHSDYCTDK